MLAPAALQIKSEIVGGRDAIAKCGIPKQALRGFRCPFLSDKPEVRQVLFEAGFRYDSTIGARGGSSRQFPATMDKVCVCVRESRPGAEL